MSGLSRGLRVGGNLKLTGCDSLVLLPADILVAGDLYVPARLFTEAVTLEKRQFLEVLEDRSGTRATIVASQLPVASWHDVIGEPTVADAILDRLVHNAHRIELKGASMRKRKPQAREKGKED